MCKIYVAQCLTAIYDTDRQPVCLSVSRESKKTSKIYGTSSTAPETVVLAKRMHSSVYNLRFTHTVVFFSLPTTLVAR